MVFNMHLLNGSMATMASTTPSLNTTPVTNTEEKDSLALVYTTIMFCVFVLVIGTVGNMLVLIVFGTRWSKLKTCEMLMISLACADLIGTIVVPCKLLLEVLEYTFHPIGHAGCKIISFLSMTSLTVSALTLVVISVDRFLIVKWPLRKRPEVLTIIAVIIFTWLLSGGVGLSYFVGDRIQLHYDQSVDIHVCRDFGDSETRKTHVFIAIFMQLILPISLITLVYPLIIIELRKGAKNQLIILHQRAARIRLKRNRKAAILLITIIIVFYVCVLPINIFYLMYMYESLDLSFHKIVHIFAILQMLQMANSCANPVIYSKLHTSFRRMTLKLFCSCCSREFKKYRWESFRNTMTTSMSMRSKRSSRSSNASSREFLTSRKITLDDLNHNKKRIKSIDMSPLFSPMCTNTSEYRFSFKENDLPTRRLMSDGDDEVFQTSLIARQDSLKKPLLKTMMINGANDSTVAQDDILKIDEGNKECDNVQHETENV